MKNLFSINVKTQEKTYSPYVVRSVSAETSSQQEAFDEQLTKSEKASKLPLWLRIVQLLCGIVAVCIFCGLMRAFGENEHDESFSEMWARFVGNGAITMIIVGVICLAVFIALLVWGKLRSNKVQASPEYQTVIATAEKLQNSSYEELGVPADADELDVFSYAFKYNRKGKERCGTVANYITISVKIFKDEDSLYFADTSEVIKIPLSAVKTVDSINKRLSFMGWSKDQKPNSPEYKPYKIRVNNMGILFVKWCLSVKLILDGEEFEIIIPPYESEILKKYVDIEQSAAPVTEQTTENDAEEAAEHEKAQEIEKISDGEIAE